MSTNDRNIEKFALRCSSEIKFSKSLLEVYPDHSEEWTNLLNNAEISFQKFLSHEISWNEMESAEKSLEPISKFAKEFTIHYIGHAHIDMNWLWPWQETVDVCYKTFTTVNKLMDEHPEFRFSQSQTSVYKAMEDYSPETFKSIQEKAKNGQWEVTANTWVEGDKNMASGEALVRQILYSKRYFKDKFGIPYDAIKIDWEPDTFGHAWTYPQILKKAGIKRYYFCRAGKGYRLFWWQAPDGSKVLAWNDEKFWYMWPPKPEDTIEVIVHYKETGMKDYMIVYGVGDHGGGPTRRDIEMIKEMQRWPIFPKIKFSTTDEYFSIAEKFGDKLPVVNEELNFTFRGCYTSQSNIKRANRYAENALGQSESYALLTNKMISQKYPADQLYQSWLNTLFNQFHDILPGSGVHETYQYSQGLYQITMANTNIIKENAFKTIANEINSKDKGDISVTVFNSLGWRRTGVVNVNVYDKFVDVYEKNTKSSEFVLINNSGDKVPVQYHLKKDNFGLNFYEFSFVAKDVPAWGYRNYYLKKVDLPVFLDGVTLSFDGVNEKIIENAYLKVKIESSCGAITSLTDKRNNIEYVPDGKALGLLQILHEAPNDMSAWVIGQIMNTEDITGSKVEVIENGPVKVSVRTFRKYKNSEITMDIILYDGIPKVDFRMSIKWVEAGDKDRGIPLLKVAFPINADKTEVTYEIPFGSIKRNENVSVASLSKSQFNMSSLTVKGEDVPAQKWADITGMADKGKIGFCLVNDNKYGFDHEDDTLRMSLIRSSYNPDPFPEIGNHEIKFAIYPHDERSKISDFMKLGYEFNNDLGSIYDDPHGGQLEDKFEGISISQDNIIISSIKKAEDDDSMILRMYEVNGIKTTVSVKLYLPSEEVAEVNLLEQSIGKTVKIKDGTFNATFEPYEIKTFKIK
ncbi:MAG: glycosyl hydrolase-related protein [Thermotogae bacterium]|jgi:alpha-mannosidase|nr:glycosyl hydrolase-related protein [Thermotogota bacterium]MCL5033467.1 glycosyl hydrolase-related protein [Thermotogota bacterium]